MNAQTRTPATDERPTPAPAMGNGHDPDTRQYGEPAQAGFGVLLRKLAHEVPELLGKEVALAKREMHDNLESAKAGAIAMATGGAVLQAGFIILLLSGVYALGTIVDPWLAALIVGGGVVVVGLVMLVAGKKQLEADALRPDRTMNSMKKDRDAIRRSTP